MLTHLYNRVTEMEGMKATGPEVEGRGLFFLEDVPLVEFMYLVFTCVPGESYRKRFRGLLLLFFLVIRMSPVASILLPRSGELRTQKLKFHLVRTQSLNVLPFKPGVGQYTAMHATLTARELFLAYFYPSSPFTCIFPKPLPIFSCVGLQNKIGHSAGCRFPC